ncbi:non-ribosomal peptide synthetase, partial [Clostridium cavendishii]|uniref:non-ribosomal peptide synthetase n=1 Tax=Clostridium cavendishii TaxID=349931 RepID=UPI0011604AAF
MRRDASRNPLFDVMFIMQNMEMNSLELERLKIKPYNLKNNMAKFDITMIAIEGKDNIYLNLEYAKKLYKKETIERMKEHFLNLVKKIITNRNIKIKDIEIINEDEKKKLLIDFNNTTVKYPSNKTIKELFENQVEKTPDNIAVVFENEEITYRELNDKANSLAMILRDKGVGPDVVVGIMVERSIEMIVGIISILKAGGAYLPIDISYPNERIEFILKNSDCQIVLTQKDLFNNILFNGEMLYLEEESLYYQICINLPNISEPDNLLYIIYTSGTTGTPKGVMFKNNSLANLINFEINNTNIELKTKVLQFANLCFDVASQEILSTLLAGGELYLIKDEVRKDVVSLLNFIVKKQIKTVFLPTAYFKLLQSEEKFIECLINNVRNIIVAGEQLTLTDKLKDLIYQSDINIHNHYGPSETHVVTTTTINASNNIRSMPVIGKPIGNNKVYILDKMMKLVPINVGGELCISGTGVARGYLNNNKLTEEKFIENPYKSGERMYKTGDLARWLPDGNIEFLGRIDHQVKVRGFRIELGEIETRLLEVEGIKEVVVVDKEKDGD